jgi:pimeloyl-ACP methyl ester carboxylesterase
MMEQTAEEASMSQSKPGFVFIHGAWHNAGTWNYVLPQLEAKGYLASALDLPGAGASAKLPAAYFIRPLDAAAFASEASPNAGITQEERTRAVIGAIEGMDRPVVLVGHSFGGLTISAVAEAVPERLAAVVYLTAFLLPNGMPGLAMIQHETMVSALVPSLFLADPAQVGALRLDPRSDDPAYRAKLKAAFYADVSDDILAVAIPSLHCDEPAGVAVNPSPITADRFGRVPRHYIRCVEDRAIPLAGQDFMIAAVDAAIGGKTKVRTLAASHSPFYSQPDKLVEALTEIVG